MSGSAVVESCRPNQNYNRIKRKIVRIELKSHWNLFWIWSSFLMAHRNLRYLSTTRLKFLLVKHIYFQFLRMLANWERVSSSGTKNLTLSMSGSPRSFLYRKTIFYHAKMMKQTYSLQRVKKIIDLYFDRNGLFWMIKSLQTRVMMPKPPPLNEILPYAEFG